MKNPQETIGNLIDNQSVSFISSIDENGYPNTKAMLPPVKREGIKTFYWHTNSPSMRVKQYNMNCVFLDCNRITIGDDVLITHGVHIYTVFHPVSAKERFNKSVNEDFPFATYINPQYNLFDVGLGLNGLLAYDMVEGIQKDNFGHERPKNGRTTTGFELNWNARLYFIPIPKINSRIFAEGCGMSLVVYWREFPENGTRINVGTNIGLGMEYPINNYKAYTILKWFHSSNGKAYENNPALNTVGIIMGLQF